MKEIWDETYDDDAYAFGTEPNDFLKEMAHYLPPKSNLLCIAEGEGRNAVFLASKGFTVSAIDQSEIGQQKAMKLAEKQNVSFAYDVVDIRDYDMGKKKWDGIVAIFAHTEPDVRQHMLQSAKEGLKTGGVFLLEGYNAEQLNYGTGGPKEHYKMFSLAELKDSFNDYTLIKAENTIRDIHEGEYHYGKSSVVQFIAKK